GAQTTSTPARPFRRLLPPACLAYGGGSRRARGAESAVGSSGKRRAAQPGTAQVCSRKRPPKRTAPLAGSGPVTNRTAPRTVPGRFLGQGPASVAGPGHFRFVGLTKREGREGRRSKGTPSHIFDGINSSI